MKIIDTFRGPTFYLSNFYHHKVEYDGLIYDNNEAAFQAAKLPDNNYVCPKTKLTRKSFTGVTPNVAKSQGRRVQLRSDWEDVKDSIMREIVEAKFSDNALKAKLLSTGEAELIEGNTWNDRYWGVDSTTGIGQNKLGQILMDVRTKMRGDN